MTDDLALFSVALPEGGHFKASWPENITRRSLRMAESMLLPTLDIWKEHKLTETEQNAALEVDSWLDVLRSPPAASET